MWAEKGFIKKYQITHRISGRVTNLGLEAVWPDTRHHHTVKPAQRRPTDAGWALGVSKGSPFIAVSENWWICCHHGQTGPCVVPAALSHQLLIPCLGQGQQIGPRPHTYGLAEREVKITGLVSREENRLINWGIPKIKQKPPTPAFQGWRLMC